MSSFQWKKKFNVNGKEFYRVTRDGVDNGPIFFNPTIIFGGVNTTISDALHIICMGKPFGGKENRKLLNQTEIEAEPWKRPQKNGVGISTVPITWVELCFLNSSTLFTFSCLN